MRTQHFGSLVLVFSMTVAIGCMPGESSTGTAGTSGGGAGTTGSAGTNATAGTNGAAGTNATAGTNGAAGTSAAAGTNGAAGTSAAAGRGGTTGAAGTAAAGTSGGAGRGGTTGAAGTAAAGTSGAAGRGGTTGAAGTAAAGTSGAAGRGGTTGTAGTTGGSSMGCDFWVASNGSDSAAGTEAAPFATFQKAYDTMCPPPANASGTVACQGTSPNWSICFKSGTYNMNASLYIRSTRSGTQAKTLKVWAAPNATTRPILNFSSQPRLPEGQDPENTDRGIKVNGDWIHVRGFEVTRANDNGIHIQGSNNIVENCVVHDNDDTGVQIGINTSAPSGTSGMNNTVRNCDSYRNYDAATGGENADGFGAKEASGTGNKFIGCRAWENADDGYDFYAWTSPVVLQDCWASRNAMNSSTTGPEADGNGFKLGGDDMGGNHQLMNCSAFNNKARGYTNNSGANSSCTGCTSCSNATADQGVSGISSGNCPTARGMTPRNIDGTIP